MMEVSSDQSPNGVSLQIGGLWEIKLDTIAFKKENFHYLCLQNHMQFIILDYYEDFC